MIKLNDKLKKKIRRLIVVAQTRPYVHVPNQQTHRPKLSDHSNNALRQIVQ
jgi:hypothetical protein